MWEVTIPARLGDRPRMFFRANNTVPEYRRRGAATASVRWGVALADRRGLPICLWGSPRGSSIYEKFGFEKLDPIRARVEGDDAEIVRDVMVRMPRGEPAPEWAAKSGAGVATA